MMQQPDPAASRGARCAALTKAGAQCRATATSDGMCCQHSAAYSAADRSEWGRRGSLSSRRAKTTEALAQAQTALAATGVDFSTLASVRAFLERIAGAVERNALAPSQATAISTLAALAIRLGELEVEAKLIELEETR